MTSSQFPFQVGLKLRGRHPNLLQQLGNQALRLPEQCEHEVFPVHFLMGECLRDALRFLQRLLGFNGQPIQLHT